MIFKDDISAEFTNELFNNVEKSLKFIADAKWEDGFVCQKCGNTNYCEGKAPSSRRCTRCKTEETVTAQPCFIILNFPSIRLFILPVMFVWKVNRHGANRGKVVIQTILLLAY